MRVLYAFVPAVSWIALGSCQPDYQFVPCGDGGAGPTLCIVSPAAGATLTEFGPNLTFPVEAAVSDFILRLPGQCHSITNACGHLHLILDGAQCNAPGLPYNTFSADTTLMASLMACPMAAGTHTLRLELHRDDHSPLSPPVGVQEQIIAMP